MILAGILAYLAHEMVFGEERDEPGVIREGVYSFVRHPMYLGPILLYFGLFFSTFSLATLALFVVIVIFYDYIASYEEKLLISKFGEDYVQYQMEVGKWLPELKFRKKETK
jgi:protein-S-isoprenylcysteine O-methyltransferase Ste14